ncbi:hypothetical protein KAU13_04505 [candidate division WOR-3 bacterium]|nr:hypothetical protein [candidate division WOR-3 bacterium]
MNKRVGYPRQFFITGLMILSIVLIAFLTYGDILGYFFTAYDSLTLIDTSRIQSFRDVVRIFTEPLMSGTEFVKKTIYYRPITTLSYSLDYFIWKLNPFGYHLTDLILHILVSVLVFFLIRFLTNGNRIIAWLGAIIFTTHPILVESVPATARRQDILTTFFLLFSLLLFLKHRTILSHKKGILVLSIIFYILALGTKEIAVILPFLFFVYLMLFTFSDEESFRRKIVNSTKGCLPYFIVTLIVLTWRTYILQGIGGYVDKLSIFIVVEGYFTDLLYPVDYFYPAGFLRTLFNPSNTVGQICSLIVLLSLFVFLLFYGRVLFRIVCRNCGRVTRAIGVILGTILLLSIVGILFYHLVTPYIDQLLEHARYGEGPGFLTDIMEGKHAMLVGHYFYKARDVIFVVCSRLLFFSVICFIGIYQRNKIKKFFIHSVNRKLMFLLLTWTLLPFIIYVLTLNFSHRSMYISIIPFSAILSIMLVESFQLTVRRIKMRESNYADSPRHSSLIKSTGISLKIFIIIAILLFSFIASSPLIRTYGEWEDSGNVSSMFLYNLLGIVPKLPDNAVIHIYNLPGSIPSYKTKIPHARSVTYLRDYSIKSWLDLNYPDNNMKVVIHKSSYPAVCPSNLNLEVRIEKENNVVIIVRFNGRDST